MIQASPAYTPLAHDDGSEVKIQGNAVLLSFPLSPRRHGGHRHYSRFVTLMKVLLPSLAIVLVGLVVMWPKFNSGDRRFPLGFANLSVQAGEPSSVMNARYHGTGKDNQPFFVTAAFATESAPGRLHLSAPKADITLRDGTWLILGANRGQYQYRRDSAFLDLEGEVSLFHDGGYQLHTHTARVDLKAGTASGDSLVNGQGPLGILAGEGFLVFDRGRTVVLTGRSRLRIEPDVTPSGNLSRKK